MRLSGINYGLWNDMYKATKRNSFHWKFEAAKKDSKPTNRDIVPATAIQSVWIKMIWITANNYNLRSTDVRITTEIDEMIIMSVLFGSCFCRLASIRFIPCHVEQTIILRRFSLKLFQLPWKGSIIHEQLDSVSLFMILFMLILSTKCTINRFRKGFPWHKLGWNQLILIQLLANSFVFRSIQINL